MVRITGEIPHPETGVEKLPVARSSTLDLKHLPRISAYAEEVHNAAQTDSPFRQQTATVRRTGVTTEVQSGASGRSTQPAIPPEADSTHAWEAASRTPDRNETVYVTTNGRTERFGPENTTARNVQTKPVEQEHVEQAAKRTWWAGVQLVRVKVPEDAPSSTSGAMEAYLRNPQDGVVRVGGTPVQKPLVVDVEEVAGRTADVAGRSQQVSSVSKDIADRAGALQKKADDTLKKNASMLHPTIVVGSDTLKGLKAVGQAVVDSFTPDPKLPFTAVLVEEAYPSVDEARRSIPFDPDGLMTPGEASVLGAATKEVPGIPEIARPEFALNGPKGKPGEPVLDLGAVVDINNEEKDRFAIPLSLVLDGHGGFVGGTSSGKTSTMYLVALRYLQAVQGLYTGTVLLSDQQKTLDPERVSALQAGAGLNPRVFDLTPDLEGFLSGINPLERVSIPTPDGKRIWYPVEQQISDLAFILAAIQEERHPGELGLIVRALEQGLTRLFYERRHPTFTDLPRYLVDTVNNPTGNNGSSSQNAAVISRYAGDLTTFFEQVGDRPAQGPDETMVVFTTRFAPDIGRAVAEGSTAVLNVNHLMYTRQRFATIVTLMKYRQVLTLLEKHPFPGRDPAKFLGQMDEAAKFLVSTSDGKPDMLSDLLLQFYRTGRSPGTSTEKNPGMLLALATQRPLSDEFGDTATNASWQVIGNLSDGRDVVGRRLGLDDAQTAYLGSPVTGEAIGKGRGHPANRIIITHPDSLATGEPNVVYPGKEEGEEYLLIPPAYKGPVRFADWKKVQEIRRNDPNADDVVTGLIAIGAIAAHLGLEAVSPDPSHPTDFVDIRKILQAFTPDQRDARVSAGVEEVVSSLEGELGAHNVDVDEFARYAGNRIRRSANSDVRPDAPEEVRFDLIAPEARVNPLYLAVTATVPAYTDELPGVTFDSQSKRNGVAQLRAVENGIRGKYDKYYESLAKFLTGELSNPPSEFNDFAGATYEEKYRSFLAIKETIEEHPELLPDGIAAELVTARTTLQQYLASKPGLTGDLLERWNEVYSQHGIGISLPEGLTNQLDKIEEWRRDWNADDTKTRTTAADLFVPAKPDEGHTPFERAIAAAITLATIPRGKVNQREDPDLKILSRTIATKRIDDWANGVRLFLNSISMDPYASHVIADFISNIISDSSLVIKNELARNEALAASASNKPDDHSISESNLATVVHSVVTEIFNKAAQLRSPDLLEDVEGGDE